MVIYGQPGSTLFFNIISCMARFAKEKVIERKMRVLIFSITLSETFLVLKRIEMNITINVC